ncbi:tail assembly chaperone [Gordonia phage Tarzan]|uniref:Tail assembly chaperone n=1 Tax=Gordonia phage Tarzan TaxID=3038367 RepID=A0AAF0K1F2_9CAUD|nr:tail assembly chaperone [Gordonia phage Tarzan]WGH20049.1 tail assembly chaperone [Gordonia phage Tarzan]
MTARDNINLDDVNYPDIDDRDGFEAEPSEYDRMSEHPRHQAEPHDLRDNVVIPADIDTDRPQPNRAQRRAADRRPQQPARRPNSSRPAGAPEPQDYRPPVQREAESAGADDDGDEYIDIDFDGPDGRTHTFTVPADPQDWPGSVLYALENRQALTAINGLIGAKSWMVIRDWKMRDINRLYEAIATAGGFAPQGTNAKGTAGGN